MELYLGRPHDYESLYNCSFYDVNTIPVEDRTHYGLGVYFMTMAIVFELLYIPCMFAIWKHMENPCYKIMFYIGVNDMFCMLMNGIITGILAMYGAVYCSYPNLIYCLGVYGLSLWASETSAELILAFNRCVEICSPKLGETLFKGYRTWLWMLIPTLYGVYWTLYAVPTLFTGLYVSWFFNPHIGYVDDPGLIYRNDLHEIHDIFVITVLSATYLTFGVILWLKTSKNSVQGTAQNNYSQKMIFIQVVLISSINAIAAGICNLRGSASIMGLLTSPRAELAMFSRGIIILGQTTWLMAHGIPPVIYLTMNRTIRNDVKRMLKQLYYGKKFTTTFTNKGVSTFPSARINTNQTRVSQVHPININALKAAKPETAPMFPSEHNQPQQKVSKIDVNAWKISSYGVPEVREEKSSYYIGQKK